MFKQNFVRLCNKNKKSPSSVCVEIGITPAAYAQWSDKTVPRRATLQKIADYFGVTVESLLSDQPDRKEKSPTEVGEDEDIKLFAQSLSDLTEDELRQVLNYAEFLRKQRNS